MIAAIGRWRRENGDPVVVALDGGSGSGKTTIAESLARQIEMAVVTLDDFYQTRVPESELRSYTAVQKLDMVFDWERVRRDALEPLRASMPGRWRAFDFSSGLGPTGTYRVSDQVTEVGPAPVILVDGAYSASPQLRDLIDISVLVEVPPNVRHSRLSARGDDPKFLASWHEIWDEVEAYYFEYICPPASFDVVIRNY